MICLGARVQRPAPHKRASAYAPIHKQFALMAAFPAHPPSPHQGPIIGRRSFVYEPRPSVLPASLKLNVNRTPYQAAVSCLDNPLDSLPSLDQVSLAPWSLDSSTKGTMNHGSSIWANLKLSKMPKRSAHLPGHVNASPVFDLISSHPQLKVIRFPAKQKTITHIIISIISCDIHNLFLNLG